MRLNRPMPMTPHAPSAWIFAVGLSNLTLRNSLPRDTKGIKKRLGLRFRVGHIVPIETGGDEESAALCHEHTHSDFTVWLHALRRARRRGQSRYDECFALIAACLHRTRRLELS